MKLKKNALQENPSSLEAIGQRIKILREEKHMTQDELARILHVSREWVNKAERGGGDMKTGIIVELAKALGTDCDYLLQGVNTQYLSLSSALGLSNDTINVLEHMKKTIDILSIHSGSNVEEEAERGSILKQFSDELDAINTLIAYGSHHGLLLQIYKYLINQFSDSDIPGERYKQVDGDKEITLDFRTAKRYELLGIIQSIESLDSEFSMFIERRKSNAEKK
ncbi:MAG: helix-turn-helix transcriptional regulator [Clostridia bacterium]|nr:helix-turn-helix transcriptional regulator [Clostridia bacterium]